MTCRRRRKTAPEAVQATTIAEAQVPDKASSPKILQNLGVGLIVGLLMGLGVAVLRHVLDTRVRNEDDVRAVTASPDFGCGCLRPRGAIASGDSARSAAGCSIRGGAAVANQPAVHRHSESAEVDCDQFVDSG